MPLSHTQLTALHTKATQQLIYKLSKVPARVWFADYKPTIKDIYNNSEYVAVAAIPNEYQIWFIFNNFEQFVAQDFQVRKREGDMNVNMAIWYWQLDFHHSLSSLHWTSRFNIVMAHVVAITGMLDDLKGDPLYSFIGALIKAFRESATKQDDFEHKQRFLSLWASGPYDYIYWGNKGRTAVNFAIKALEQAPPVDPFDRESGMENFWDMLQYEKPKDRQRHGARWAVHYVMYLERMGKVIELDDKRIEAEYLLENDLLVQQFASGGLDGDTDHAAESVFKEPRIQALLRDAPPAQKRPNDTKKEDMWMSPDEALAMLRESEVVKKALREEEEKMEKDMAGLSTS